MLVELWSLLFYCPQCKMYWINECKIYMEGLRETANLGCPFGCKHDPFNKIQLLDEKLNTKEIKLDIAEC